MIVVIDRFEESFAVCECEDKAMINVEKDKLPEDAHEGDVLIIEGEDIKIDYEETEKRKREIEEFMSNMWEE